MLEIAYTICFLATAQCQEKTLSLMDDTMTPLGCNEKALEAIIPELQKFAEGKVTLKRWGCRRVTKGI